MELGSQLLPITSRQFSEWVRLAFCGWYLARGPGGDDWWSRTIPLGDSLALGASRGSCGEKFWVKFQLVVGAWAS